jgi:hypothetical protein
MVLQYRTCAPSWNERQLCCRLSEPPAVLHSSRRQYTTRLSVFVTSHLHRSSARRPEHLSCEHIQGRRGSFQDSMSRPSRLSSTLMRRRTDQLCCRAKPHSCSPTPFKACSSAGCLCLERRSVKLVALISTKTTAPLASSPTTSKCRRPSEFASDFVGFFELRDLVACYHRAVGTGCIDLLALTRI